jgi:hypothetical protein
MAVTAGARTSLAATLCARTWRNERFDGDSIASMACNERGLSRRGTLRPSKSSTRSAGDLGRFGAPFGMQGPRLVRTGKDRAPLRVQPRQLTLYNA